MPDKSSRIAASRSTFHTECSETQQRERNGSKTSSSYLDKLPSDMLINMYKVSKRQQQAPTSIHDVIFSRLREIERQYHEETSAKVVKDLRRLVNQSIHDSVLDEIDSGTKQRRSKSMMPISAGTQKGPQKSCQVVPTHPRETRLKGRSAQDKLSQLLDDDYVKPKATISSNDVSDYLTGRAGLVQRDIGKYITEYTKRRQRDVFEAKLAKIESLAVSSESKQAPFTSSRCNPGYSGTESHIVCRPAIDTETRHTTLSIASVHEQISLNGCSKGSTYRSSAGEALDDPTEKIRVLTHGSSLGPAERGKRRLESKRRILLQALKRTNSYTEKEAIMNKLQSMMG